MRKELLYEAQDKTYAGYLAHNEPSEAVPGILVLHGGGGLGLHARERAQKLAEIGYVAFAPDMFGESVEGVEQAQSVVAHYTENWSTLRERCNAALQCLKCDPWVDDRRTAAIGFCFGGQAALELARSGVDLKAVVGFHSQLATNRPQDSVNIKARVLVCLGDRDCFVSRNDREAFLENMTESGVDCQMMLFGGIGHAFTDPHAAAANIPGIEYDALADKRSWNAMKALFNEVF